MASQIRRLILIVGIVAMLGVSGRAGTDWVLAEALGDVAVSFDGSVQVFDNANIGPTETITTGIGTSGGLAFDAGLNLLVANTTAGANQLVKITADPTHTISTIGTQPSPAALAFAADGSVYVASLGGTIRRLDKNGNPLRTFTVSTDSTTCIDIDLSPDQRTLFMVSGGRTIKTISDVSLTGGPPGPAPPALTVATFVTLPTGSGTACGLRLLAPVDARSLGTPPATPLPAFGGILVADGREIKQLDRFGVLVGTFNAGEGPDSKRKWIDLALDPNTQDFWGIDAGDTPQLVKFRFGGPNQLLIGLSGFPRGVAVNGELRAAQATRVLSLQQGVEGVATFLVGTPFQSSWKAIAPENVTIAVHAYEVTYNPDGPVTTFDPDGAGPLPAVCAPSLDVRCRLQKFDSPLGNPVPKPYSRGRSVVYREILLSALTNPNLWTISFVFPANNTDKNHAGLPCVPGTAPESSSGVLRDPYLPDFFSLDPSLGFYGGDDVIPIRSKGNDSIVVDRADGQFNMLIIKPVLGAVGQLGSSLPIAVEVTNPLPTGCTDAPALESKLLLTVVDITVVNGQPLDTVVGDSKGILGGAPLIGNGGIFAKVANQYRTNLDLSKSRFVKNHTYRLCVSALAAETPDQEGDITPPSGGEVCQDILTK